MPVYAARWVVPVAAPPVADGAVAVDAAGRIAYVGPRAGAPALGPVHDLGDAVLTPGLVAVNTPATPGAVRRALAHGVATTAYLAPNLPSALATLDALAASNARGTVYAPVVGVDPAERAVALTTLQEHVATLRARLAELGAGLRVRIGVTPALVHALHEDLLLDACAWAVGQHLPLAMRVSESRDELAFLRDAGGPLADALRARGLAVQRRAHSAVHLLAELGVAAVAQPLLVGGTHFDESDVALAAYYDCPVAVTTSLAPVRALLNAGVRVALGASAARPAALPAAEALHLCTLGGARALDAADDVGSLEPGKQADLAAFALDGASADPAAAVFSGRAVLTVVAGEVVARHPGCEPKRSTPAPPPRTDPRPRL